MSNKQNMAEVLRNMPKPELGKIISQLSEEEAEEILYDSWEDIWCRSNQQYDPSWPENIILYMAGRG